VKAKHNYTVIILYTRLTIVHTYF